MSAAAAAMGYEVGIFFNFFGLNLLNKKKLEKVKITSVGQTVMPMHIPQMVAVLPGMTDMKTKKL